MMSCLQQFCGVMNAQLIEKVDVRFSRSCFKIFTKCFHREIRRGGHFLQWNASMVFSKGKGKYFIDATSIIAADAALQQLRSEWLHFFFAAEVLNELQKNKQTIDSVGSHYLRQ